jgi:predicted nucleic acid-binding protein
MPGEVVVDASVAAKIFITEVGSVEARALFLSGIKAIAPDLVIVELTNVAAKRVRRGDIPRSVGERMVDSVRTMFEEFAPCAELMARAFVLAADHGLSTYDATYVALAEARGCDLVTADEKLVARVVRAGLTVTLRTL